MKYTICCILFLLSTILSFAQRVSFNKGGTDSKNYYEEIPYEFVNDLMFVTTEINGVKRKFLFDTGAPVQVTSELFEELKLEVINHTNVTDATGKKTSLDIVAIPELKLNNLSFTGTPALVSNSSLYKCLHIDGVIGSNLLRKSIVRIVPSKRVIILTDDETKVPIDKKMQARLVIGEPQSYPFFLMKITDKDVVSIGFDTGSRNFLRVTESFAKQFEKDNLFEKISSGYGSNHVGLFGLQTPDSLYRLKIPSLNIAGCTFTNVVSETAKSNNNRMGVKILDYGIVTIDFIHRFFYFEPNGSNTNLNEKLWPLKPMVADNKLIVGVVWGKLKDEIKSGDLIIAIDDVSCEAMNFCDWVDGKSDRMMDKETAILTIKDEKGIVKKISIAKE